MGATIGVFTDIHANLPALNAVLAGLDEVGCDLIVHTGDAIAIGPYPVEVMAALRGRPEMWQVMGNHDALFVQGLPTGKPAWMGDGEYHHQRWTHAQLSDRDRATMATWPYARNLEIDRIRFHFCHYAWDHGRQGFASPVWAPSPCDLDALFADCAADVVCYGHHHPRSDLAGIARYINPGAAGASHDGLARYAILEVSDDGPFDVHLSAAPYDRDAVLREFEARDVPGRGEILRTFFGQSG